MPDLRQKLAMIVLNNWGLKGMAVVLAILTFHAIRNAITKATPSATIRDIAVSEGMVTIKEAGLLKVRNGITSLTAALEVTGGD